MSEIPEPADKPGQRHDLLSRFSNPWMGLLTAIFSVVAVPLAIYLYLAGAKTRRLTYSVNPVKTIVVKGGEASTLRVLHGDQDIKGDVTAAQVAIWNDGTESIRPENVLSPVCIVLRPSVAILEAKIRKVSRGVIGVALDASRLTEGVVPVTWKILEHNDGALIQLIFAGSTETEIAVEGTVEGQATVLHIKPSRGIASPDVLVGRLRRARVATLGLLLASTTLYLSLLIAARLLRRSHTRSRRWDALDEFARTTLWAPVVLLFITLFLAWQELRQPGPPFGF